MRTSKKRNNSKFLVSYNFTSISGAQGFGFWEINISDSNFRRRHILPALESIKKDNSFKTVIILNIIKL